MEWLQAIRKECWISRGLYPGLASVLRFLGMEKPEEFIRVRLKNHPINAIKDYFFDRFEGYEKMSKDEKDLLEPSKKRFEAMMQSGNENEELKGKLCRDKLPFFDLDEEQVKNIFTHRWKAYMKILTSLPRNIPEAMLPTL